MAVYLIRAGANGPVKIGKTDKPKKRVWQLQISHYEILYLLRVWEGGIKEEASLHEQFRDLHIRGEWFGFSRAMLGDVGLIEIYNAAENEPASGQRPNVELLHKEVIRRLGGTTKVAQALGRPIGMVNKWCQRSIPPAHWGDICALANGKGLTLSRSNLLAASPRKSNAGF